jgi:hypothetical protein
MDIPVANTVEISVNPGIFIKDNSNNLICANVEPTQLINQTATLETECIIISLPPQQTPTLFSITIPNYNFRFCSSPNDYQITILFCCMFLSYTAVLIFIIFLLNNKGPRI